MLDLFGKLEVFAVELFKTFVERGAAGTWLGGVEKRGLFSFDGDYLVADLV